jgi:hypothetical protein
LSNTRDRLECLYGAAHRFELLESPQGLTVRIEIPWSPAGDGSARVA